MNTQSGYKPHAPKPVMLGGSEKSRNTFGKIGGPVTLWDRPGRAVNGTITAFSGSDPCWGSRGDDGQSVYMVVKIPVTQYTHPKDRLAFKRLADRVRGYVSFRNLPGYFEKFGSIQDFVIMLMYLSGGSVKLVRQRGVARCGARDCYECGMAMYAKFKDEHGITRFAPLEWLTDAAEEVLEQRAANNIVKGLKINA